MSPTGGYEFDFPKNGDPMCKPEHTNLAGVHYVTKVADGPLQVGQTITMRFAIVGDGALEPKRTNGETNAGPAGVTLYFQRQGDNRSGLRDL